MRTWRAKQRLSDLDLGMGRIIISAADDDELAREYASLEHGVFTHSLLRILSDTSFPAYTISVAILYDTVSKDVRAYTHDAQHPIMIGRSRDAQFPHLVPR